MKAHEAEIVAGIISSSKDMLVFCAVAASIGSTSVVVARFELTSVKKVMHRQINKITK